MSVKKILTMKNNEKLLRTRSEPVKKIDKSVKQLIQDIKDTMEHVGDDEAAGLAAIQIGVPKRIFGAFLNRHVEEGEAQSNEQEEKPYEPPVIFINPEILSNSEDQERGFDGCLSIPGMMGYTDRHLKLRIRYMDEDGKTQERDFEGWDARVIQHEYDHLEGVLFLDRLDPMKDLFVYTRDEKGKVKTVPYAKIVEQAAQAANEKPSPLKP
jgi:peptide deformylase